MAEDYWGKTERERSTQRRKKSAGAKASLRYDVPKARSTEKHWDKKRGEVTAKRALSHRGPAKGGTIGKGNLPPGRLGADMRLPKAMDPRKTGKRPHKPGMNPPEFARKHHKI